MGILIPLTFMPRDAQAMITIVVTASVELNFGTIAVVSAGTVTMNTANSRSVAGGVTAVGGAGLESSGVLSISGSTGLAIVLSMSSPSFNVSNGGDMMVVNNFNLVTNGGGQTETVTLTSSPTTYSLGARLNVGAAQSAGTYTGSYTINANYM